jgi:hypothetical protein
MSTQLQPAASKTAHQVSLSGFDLINTPRLNKGTAFATGRRRFPAKRS